MVALPRAGRRLALVADDLTGAADAAAPFANRGAEVSLKLSGMPRGDVDVLALLSDSRWREPSDAARRVAPLVTQARAWGADSLFVKVDSTLRGNVRAEVRAALEVWGGQAIAAPAFPAQGRVVRRGVLIVHGEAQQGSVADFFPDDVTVLDAETDQQLDRIAACALNEGAVAVGSAGLARALAAATWPGAAVARRPRGPVVGVLVVVGTGHPASRAQAVQLIGSGALCLVVTHAAPVRIDEAVATLVQGGRVLVMTDIAHRVATDSLAAAALAAELALVVAAISVAAPSAAMVLTGGATALAVAQALEARTMRLLGEIGPGIAIGELDLPDRSIATISKSGGFGAQDALIQAVTTLEACA